MMKPQLTYYDISPDTTAFSTTRHGGHSTGNYAELNINRYCGDNPEDIEKNLEDLCRELGVDKERVIMPHQTHGTEVMQIGADFLSLSATVKGMILEGVDALITDVKDVCIGVSTADCIPILIYDYAHHAAAAVHAGWRGTAKRIACKAVKMMEVSFGSRPEDLTAVIGPGISIDAFEVGDEVYAEFEAAGFNMADISRKGRQMAHRPARMQPQAAGSHGTEGRQHKRVGGMHLQQQQRLFFGAKARHRIRQNIHRNNIALTPKPQRKCLKAY